MVPSDNEYNNAVMERITRHANINRVFHDLSGKFADLNSDIGSACGPLAADLLRVGFQRSVDLDPVTIVNLIPG